MVSSNTLLALAAIGSTSLVAAQNSTISLFLPGFPMSLHATRAVASIIGANDTFRVYDVHCATDDLRCTLPASLTVTQGVNSMAYTVSESGAVSTQACSFSGTNAYCQGAITGGPSEGNYMQDIGGFRYATATVTAGQSYLAKDLVTPGPTTVTITAAPSATAAATAKPAGQAVSSTAGGAENKALGGIGGMLAVLAFAVVAL